MNATWQFDNGQLVARDESNSVIWYWLADDAIGKPFAYLLNHTPALSRILLAPFIGDAETVLPAAM
jgi:hypothetical protein